MNTQTIPDSLLDEMLCDDIPCHACGRTATLRSFVHNCPAETRPIPVYKCITCWKNWAQRPMRVFALGFPFRCSQCKQDFCDLESFSDYREF